MQALAQNSFSLNSISNPGALQVLVNISLLSTSENLTHFQSFASLSNDMSRSIRSAFCHGHMQTLKDEDILRNHLCLFIQWHKLQTTI